MKPFSLCDKLGILEREHLYLIDRAYAFQLDPATNEYPPEAHVAFAKVRGNEKAQRAIMAQMDEQTFNEPEGSRR